MSPTSGTATATTRLFRVARRMVGTADWHWRWIKLERGCGFFLRGGELLKSTSGIEEFVAVDVRVSRDGREVGVAEVLGDEARIAELLPEPGRGGVTQRVRRNVLRDASACRCPTDDVGEGRLLQTTTGEPAEHRVGRIRLATVAQLPKLLGKTGRHRLAARFAAFAAADEERPPASIELEVAPLKRAQLGAPQSRRDEREQRKTVPLDEAGQIAFGAAGSIEQAPKLFTGQPVALLPRLRRWIEIEEGIASTVASARPPEEPAQEKEATVIRRWSRLRPVLVPRQVVDDRRLVEDGSPIRLGPVEQVIDRDSVGDHGALALVRRLEPSQPIVASLPERRTIHDRSGRRCSCGRNSELAEARRKNNERRPVVRGRASIDQRGFKRRERRSICRTRNRISLCARRLSDGHDGRRTSLLRGFQIGEGELKARRHSVYCNKYGS
jgi:hypothetical protein